MTTTLQSDRLAAIRCAELKHDLAFAARREQRCDNHGGGARPDPLTARHCCGDLRRDDILLEFSWTIQTGSWLGDTMKTAFALFGLAGVVVAGALAGALVGAGPAHAVIYCKYVGYPKGCVARPGVTLAPRPVVYCTYIGYPAGCVARPGVVLRPAPAAVVAPGRGVNLGGPVNRRGIR